MQPPSISSSKTFLSQQNKIPHPLSSYSLFLPSSSSWYHQSAFCLIDLFILDISYKWNHIVCGLSHLVYFIYHSGLKILPHCNMFQYFVPFSWLNNIPPYVSTSFCLFIHLLMSIWGCFYFGAIVNSTAVHTGVQVFVWVLVCNSFEWDLIVSKEPLSPSSYH